MTDRGAVRVESTDPLIKFFYILLRDYVQSGVVEGIIRDHVFAAPDKPVCVFSDELLAAKAIYVAERLRGLPDEEAMRRAILALAAPPTLR